MLPSWWSACTVLNQGSGFQMPGVWEFWFTAPHVSAAEFWQSGSVPLTT